MRENYKMIAKTFYGFEDILAKELQNLGAINVQKGVRSVHFEGDKGFMYKANISLRTALKILKPIHHFKIQNEEEYYRKIFSFDWASVMSPSQTFAIDVTSLSEKFTHDKYLSYRAKDAIVDKFRKTHNKRPNIDTNHPDFQFHFHISKTNEVTISVDSSGASLHHRGYRTATNIAPINEVLAAGILLLSGWDGSSNFIDPMCGSGTFLIEAAMIACNIPANIHRREFAFEKWNDYDVDLFETIFDAQVAKIREFHYHIIGYDKAPSAVAKAKDNVKNANLSDYIRISQEDFFKTQKEDSQKCHMVFNPPYGERLSVDIPAFYKSIGDTLKQHYTNTEAWIITSNAEAIKNIGLRPSRKIKLYNGKLESTLLNFSIYEGTKKIHKINSGNRE